MPIANVLLMKLEKNFKNIGNLDDYLFKMFLSFNYRHNFVTAYAMYDTQNPAFHGKT